ncbi:hypothetical protein FBU59_003831 [Linderina macrospora]|uniref:Uncharacterized protein n=1 Tax=Linderina macrospora TaxID=4868 RepID=A0ACC1J7E4_9FUNG|nr:hypothetical protein FBU59_003831 [Linderina macrospora]
MQSNGTTARDSERQRGADSTEVPPTAPVRKRLSLACTTCRQRKVKCDGARPSCKTCAKFNWPCIYQPSNRKRGPRPRALAGMDAPVPFASRSPWGMAHGYPAYAYGGGPPGMVGMPPPPPQQQFMMQAEGGFAARPLQVNPLHSRPGAYDYDSFATYGDFMASTSVRVRPARGMQAEPPMYYGRNPRSPLSPVGVARQVRPPRGSTDPYATAQHYPNGTALASPPLYAPQTPYGGTQEDVSGIHHAGAYNSAKGVQIPAPSAALSAAVQSEFDHSQLKIAGVDACNAQPLSKPLSHSYTETPMSVPIPMTSAVQFMSPPLPPRTSDEMYGPSSSSMPNISSMSGFKGDGSRPQLPPLSEALGDSYLRPTASKGSGMLLPLKDSFHEEVSKMLAARSSDMHGSSENRVRLPPIVSMDSLRIDGK